MRRLLQIVTVQWGMYLSFGISIDFPLSCESFDNSTAEFESFVLSDAVSLILSEILLLIKSPVTSGYF